MRLFLGHRSYDLGTSALVMGTVGRAGSVDDAVSAGADIVEVGDIAGLARAAVPVCVVPPDDGVLAASLAAGASMVRMGPGGSTAAYAMCATAGVAVIVDSGAAAVAEAAGVRSDRIVVEGGPGAAGGRFPVLVDVTRCSTPVAATAACVVRGARIVRTDDVRGARRICDVLGALMRAAS